MSAASWHIFSMFGFFIVLVALCGIYYIVVTRNLMRVLIGLELLTKAVTLLIVVAGYITGKIALAQAMVITLIVIEVVVIAIAAGVVVSIFRATDSIDARNIRDLKG